MTATTDKRTQRSERTRAKILRVAIREFAAKGLSGARIDEIAEKANANKRMIYVYFGNKDGLYLAVIEECYRRVRELESKLDIAGLPAPEALAALVRHTVEYQAGNEDFIRLVMTENINKGAFLKSLKALPGVNRPAIEQLASILDRGVREGVFEEGIDPVDLHMSISALSFFNVSNRYTFSRIFDRDMRTKAALEKRREFIVREIMLLVLTSTAATGLGFKQS